MNRPVLLPPADETEASSGSPSADVFVFPASFGQKGLWLVDQLNPGSTAYGLSILWRIRGPLDIAAFERTLNEVVRRHEVLRTTLSRRLGELVQVIAPAAPLSLPVVDLSALPERESDERALAEAREACRRPFDLAAGPLFRPRVWRLSGNDHRVLLDLHHVIADWWSFAVFFREIEAIYGAFVEGRGSPLAELSLQYADFAQWQRERVRGPGFGDHLMFWKKALAGAPPILDLKTDRSRPARQTFAGASESVLLTPGLTSRVRDLARRAGATPYMVLLAGFAALLQRHTGQDDILVGSPVANRTKVELEPLIGLVMNTLVMRIDLSGNPTFHELLARVRAFCLDAFAHQDMPFERLLEELKPERTLSHSPLFQVLMTLQNAAAEPPRLGDLAVESLPIAGETAKFDLSAYFEDRGDRIWASFQYNADIFEPATIRWMLGHFLNLLDGALSDPGRPLLRLPLTSEAEQWNGRLEIHRISPSNPFVEFRRDDIEQSIVERFEEQVRRDPSRVAARAGDESWTYDHLAREVDGAARTVLELASSSPQRVALLFDQDLAMLAAILGSLKAGKAYVPLDPSYPAERLAYMLHDSGSALILTNDANLEFAETLARGRCPVASVDRARPSGPVPAPPLVEPDAAAYVLYTSGSTGQPKGVVQNHRNVLHFIRAYTNQLHLGPEDRLSLLASYSFDAAIMDIFGALLNGATLCLWNFKKRGVLGLADWVTREGITVLHAVPTVYRAFAGSLAEKRTFPMARLLVLGGEEVHRGDVDIYRRHFTRDCLMVNGLGPTESTVALQYFLDHRTPIHGNSVPVGHPVPDTSILLLDDAGQATEIHGEIGIRSAHVALGYWNQPELTAAAFVADPDGGTHRVYRTGDFGRRLANGAIEFIGRRDSRVKVRGHRIELREIEAALEKHPSVREAVVVGREDPPGVERIVAYLVAGGATRAEGSALRSFVEGKLPVFMVPSAYVWLEAFPLTPSGKVNRAVLPVPGLDDASGERATVGPRTVLESRLVRIWEKALNVRPIGMTDNFFDLGGHSLLAIHLLTMVEKATGKTLPLSAFFQTQTIADMAARLAKDQAPSSWSSLMAIQPGGSRPPLFCVHAQGSEALEYRVFAGHLGPDQPLYGLSPQGLDGKLPPHDRVEDMAAHYMDEIREAQPEGPYYVGGWSFGGVIAFEMARQLRSAGQEVALLALFDTYSRPPVRSARPSFLRFAGWRLEFHVGAMSRLEPGKRLGYLSARASSAAGWVRRRCAAWLGRLRGGLSRPLPTAYDFVRSANQEAARVYRPQPYDGTITLFRATGMGLASSDDPYLGWGDVPGVDIEVIEVPGVHRSILREEEDIRTLAEKLSERLERAQGEHSAERAADL
jgi:amino acid adenylation domain-containing protein